MKTIVIEIELVDVGQTSVGLQTDETVTIAEVAMAAHVITRLAGSIGHGCLCSNCGRLRETLIGMDRTLQDALGGSFGALH